MEPTGPYRGSGYDSDSDSRSDTDPRVGIPYNTARGIFGCLGGLGHTNTGNCSGSSNGALGRTRTWRYCLGSSDLCSSSCIMGHPAAA